MSAQFIIGDYAVEATIGGSETPEALEAMERIGSSVEGRVLAAMFREAQLKAGEDCLTAVAAGKQVEAIAKEAYSRAMGEACDFLLTGIRHAFQEVRDEKKSESEKGE